MWPGCPDEAPGPVLPMTEVNTILFDVGGVLLTNGWDHEERAAVLAYFSVDRAAYEERHAPANDAWEKGLITADEFLEQTVFFEPRPFTPAEFLARMKAQSKVLPHGALRILGDLRASHKIQLAILNNEARELNDDRIERFLLREYFSAFFSSCYLGLRKPDVRIYRLALDVLHRGAREVIFVDDREENCAAAEDLGIHGIHYRDEAGFRRALEGFGIPLGP
jgi:putative hydrolase of the HAD superfamily